jgi:hypothetical protein
MHVPKPIVYLRNQFAVLGGLTAEFLYGKEQLLRGTSSDWDLIASCADRRVFQDTQILEPSLPAMQIWRLKNWQSLYENIYKFSDAGWYIRLGDSLASECQEFLVGILGEPHPSSSWISPTDPGYCYFYEEALPHHAKTHAYLRGLNWFATTMAAREAPWEKVWSALQITAAPSLISVLWRVPGDFERIETSLSEAMKPLANAKRYGAMMACLKTLTRRKLYPIFPEYMALKIASAKAQGVHLPMIMPTPPSLSPPFPKPVRRSFGPPAPIPSYLIR